MKYHSKTNVVLNASIAMQSQPSLFSQFHDTSLSIKDAAVFANVSQATIRNWIKAGHILSMPDGLIDKNSLDHFKDHAIGKTRLKGRANKSSKDFHDHDVLSAQIIEKTRGSSSNLEAISLDYESSLSDSFRNKEGIYYTPLPIIECLLNPRKEDVEDAIFCDPCCGSGNFLVHALNIGFKPQNIYGFDTDKNAIEIARRRISEASGVEPVNIKHADFLLEAAKPSVLQFDYIYTNPPWGKKLPKESKEQFGSIFGAGRSLDTSALFLLACLRCARDNGHIGLLLPDAFFNIAAFEDARLCVSSREILRIVDFGKAFKGLIAKAVGIELQNHQKNPIDNTIACEINGNKYDRSGASFVDNPKSIFNYWCSPHEAAVIEQAYSIPHITLARHCEWGLGIVTGDNDRYCRSTMEEGYLPVYRGADIGKGKISKPTCYIPSDLSLYQQVASRSIYDAKEKIIYKFISGRLCFFHDIEQRYVLNSANILIPKKSLGISMEQLCDLLNSDFMDWLFSKLFSTHKILRGDLEQLPIHTAYFKLHSKFDEDCFLEFLSIERGYNGTYRTKRKDN